MLTKVKKLYEQTLSRVVSLFIEVSELRDKIEKIFDEVGAKD